MSYSKQTDKTLWILYSNCCPRQLYSAFKPNNCLATANFHIKAISRPVLLYNNTTRTGSQRDILATLQPSLIQTRVVITIIQQGLVCSEKYSRRWDYHKHRKNLQHANKSWLTYCLKKNVVELVFVFNIFNPDNLYFSIILHFENNLYFLWTYEFNIVLLFAWILLSLTIYSLTKIGLWTILSYQELKSSIKWIKIVWFLFAM